MPPQLDASMFSVKNENHVGLANLSVDFSLVKVEVPKQFEGLGKALSPHRRENAERGPQHRTARRLGALFEQVIPDIEVLAAVYGERVSEIAASRQLDLKGEEYGPFSRYAGVDGTSIYAAASSGSSVIALHLLACMLARMLKDAEATAFWVQLVESRLEELKSKADPSQIHGMAALYTIQHGHQITRDDLAAWDASARAWLDIATEVKKWETTQLRLILNNIPPIEVEKDIYKFWIVAMTSIQKSIQGVPQDITNSVVLLGLMSWHIYPDLHVFSPNQFISFHDPLVKKGGIITLGLEQKGENTSGISWSISLSHLRFYGDPVTIKKSSDEDSDRITIQELQLIAFGGVLGSWANPAMVDINEAAECFDALGAALQFDNSRGETSYDAPLGWLAPLIAAARFFLLTVDKDRESALYFINFGRRRGRNLLGNDLHGAVPMFGLSNPYFNFTFLIEPKISCDNPTQYITRLRQLAEDCNFHEHDSVIITGSRYSAEPTDPHSDQFEGNWEFASAIPTQRFDPGDEDCFWLATSNEYADINLTARKWKFVWKDPPYTYRQRYSDLLVKSVQENDRPLFSASLDIAFGPVELFFKSLMAMAAVSDLYAEWSEAIISVATTKKPLGSSYWASNIWNNSTLSLDGKLWRSTKFSCLTMLESGGHDIHPDQINLVIAMATGNSIYASEALLQDPSLPDNSGLPYFRGIRRLTGNVGYPGVVLLIPPPMPRVLQVDKTRGRFVQAYPFDGTLQNSFAQTSIHLKFTEFVVPLASARGAVDADVVLREALISVYDGSRWIADLDILQAFESPDLIRIQFTPGAKKPVLRPFAEYIMLLL
ncbi:hypothetical protein FCIRC_11132 [Fusarium circinatum]|uniref:Uncharacterized protein n=1 Tax=Fusarium circinatum TaxID=48490 RepID=A0A8H5T5U9_FUSCI|nr:hypothetical protein FCIRC_11132 [Fusarium circinatum]